MKAVYAVACPFAGPVDEARTAAWTMALDWLKVDDATARAGEPGRGDLELEGGAHVEWRRTSSEDEHVLALHHVLPPSERSVVGWRTQLWVCQSDGHVWGVVRSGPESRAGVVTTHRYDVHRPKVVADWVEKLTVVRDGRRLQTQALSCGQYDADGLIELLLDPRRELPVVGIATVADADGAHPVVDPHRIASNLAGNAHVVVLQRAASWKLTEVFGKSLGAYNGAVRIWWPQFSAEDHHYRHPLVTAERLDAHPWLLQRRIVHGIWSAAVDAIGAPGLELRILRGLNRMRVEQQLAALRERKLDDDQLIEAFEEQLQLNERLQDRVAELEHENDDVRDALRAAEADDDDVDEESDEVVESVEEAVRIAASEASHVIYLDQAFASARESSYGNPRQVLADLRVLNQVADAWAENRVTDGFEATFARHPVKYRGGVSKTALKQYTSDYEISYAAARVLMGPHLRRGVGSPTAILRIYWYADEQTRQFVVGHVGRKLRDSSLGT